MQTLDRTAPLVSLEEFRRAFNFMPWHFWQLANADIPVRQSCETLTFEYAWQHVDATGRDDVAMALMQAEARLKEQLGFAVRPQYESEEIQYSMFFDLSDQYLAGIDALGRWMGFKTRYTWLKTVGLETRTLLATPTITYSDADGDGLQDTFTITATVPTGTTAEQLAVYVPSAERYDSSPVSERWRIRPARITVSGTTATIRGAKWLCARPVLYQRATPAELDPANAANMLTTMEVHRYAADTTQQGRLFWETINDGGCCSDATTTTDPSAIGETPARFVIRDDRRGFVAGESAEYSTSAAAYIATAWDNCWQPQKIELNYRAGWHIDDRLTLAVCRLAAAEMGRPVCSCREANREFARWQDDLARTDSEVSEQISFEDLGNPFGTRRGQMYAWKVAQELRQVRDAVTV